MKMMYLMNTSVLPEFSPAPLSQCHNPPEPRQQCSIFQLTRSDRKEYVTLYPQQVAGMVDPKVTSSLYQK